jgi:undecaprenyl phosphate N,N'-diacetylbacillosamine 1-phosphate transferase
MSKFYPLTKQIFDLIFSLLLILLLFPILILISALIKVTSTGPIFFIQKRVGRKGRIFGIIKFRTMVQNSENIGTGLDSYDNDPRVTKIGRILRNSSMDELPQLFNILLGDMSFVGPRPPTTYHPYVYEEYPKEKKRRFLVKPGVTGWAQINGRNQLNWDQKIKHDLIYVDNADWLFDLKILFLTIGKVVRNEGGYDK